MDASYLLLLLIVTRLTFVVLQTCRELKVHEVAHRNKRINYDQISCIVNLSLEQCALECLLIKACTSFYHGEKIQDWSPYDTVCELNTLHILAVWYQYVDKHNYVYVDIQDWPKEVAGTCADRPCAENQRCIQTTPYRCINVDCGALPAEDTNMIPLSGNTSLGSRGTYMCRDRNSKLIIRISGVGEFYCLRTDFRLCNSDSQWSENDLYCL